MMGPLVTNGIIGPFTELVFAFIIGIAFGFVLEQGGFSSGRKITGVFYFRDFAVPKVMFTAMLTAGMGIMVGHGLGLMDATAVFMPPTFIWAHLLGGLLFGVGMVVSGYCPGTAVASSAIGRKDAMMAIVGMLIGTVFFSEIRTGISEFMYAGNLGVISLGEVFHLPTGFAFLLVVAFALCFFIFANIMESKFGDPSKPVPMGPWNPVTAKWLTAMLIVLAVFIGSGAMTMVPGKPDLDIPGIGIFTDIPENLGAVDAESLDRMITAGTETFMLVDLRTPDVFSKGSLPGAFNIPARTILAGQGLNQIPTDRPVILYDNNGAMAFQLLPLLRYNDRDVTALAGGLSAWAQMKSGGTSGELKLETPSRTAPPPPVSAPGKSGSQGGFKDEGC